MRCASKGSANCCEMQGDWSMKKSCLSITAIITLLIFNMPAERVEANFDAYFTDGSANNAAIWGA